MNRQLVEVKSWLARNYESLGETLGEDLESATACWLDVDEDNAEIYDNALGLCVRFSALNDPETAYEQVLRAIKFALEKLSRLDVRSGIRASESDTLGAWQVHVCWITSPGCRPAWDAAITELRRQSSHSEEVGIELLDTGAKSLRSILEEDGLPCLMFHTRRLLSLSLSEIPKWNSPDTHFQEQLNEYLENLQDSDQRDFASGVIARATPHHASDKEYAPAIAIQANEDIAISVTHFRNIVSAHLKLPLDGHATVLYGPNGTGKSSLFEALSLGLFGASSRQLEYLRDPDLSAKELKNYTQSALRRIGANGEPSVRVSGTEKICQISSDVLEVGRRLTEASGSVLAQESAREFITMSARQAAGLILSDFSPRARQIQDAVDRGSSEARAIWQEWLRTNGLNASITREETILARLVERSLNERCPPFSATLYQWLSAAERRLGSYEMEARGIHQSIAGTDSAEGRSDVIRAVTAAILGNYSASEPVAQWLKRRDLHLQGLYDLSEELQLRVERLKSDWPSVKHDLLSWSNWLGNPTVLRVAEPTPSYNELQRVAIGRKRLEELAPLGQTLRLRKEHLDSLAANLLDRWSHYKPHSCPTCDAHHVAEIKAVVLSLREEVANAYHKVRSEYSEIQENLKRLQEDAEAKGDPPLTEDRMKELVRLLKLFWAEPADLDSALRVGGHDLTSFISDVEILLAFPRRSPALEGDDVAAAADAIASEAILQHAEGRSKQNEPRKWGQLKSHVDGLAIEVLTDHLPATLGAVWSEIAGALSPSRWNHAAKPRMHVDLQRGSERVGLVLDRDSVRVPVRHILNQAEQHILGLAWFFTRYVSHGRFVCPIVVMDDPAQDMDQVTYRKLLRFLQSLLRLHRHLDRRIHLVVLLHQEDRALDLARSVAKDGVVTMLEWAREVRMDGPNSTVRQINLRNAEQRAPKPFGAFAQSESRPSIQ